MVTSWHGYPSSITGPLWGDSISHQWILVTKGWYLIVQPWRMWVKTSSKPFTNNWHTSQWRHYEQNGVSSHRRLDCLLSRVFRLRSKKTSKFSVTGLCEGNPPVTNGFLSQRPVMWKCFRLMTSSWIKTNKYNTTIIVSRCILITYWPGNVIAVFVSYSRVKFQNNWLTWQQMVHRTPPLPITILLWTSWIEHHWMKRLCKKCCFACMLTDNNTPTCVCLDMMWLKINLLINRPFYNIRVVNVIFITNICTSFSLLISLLWWRHQTETFPRYYPL